VQLVGSGPPGQPPPATSRAIASWSQRSSPGSRCVASKAATLATWARRSASAAATMVASASLVGASRTLRHDVERAEQDEHLVLGGHAAAQRTRVANAVVRARRAVALPFIV